MAFVRLVVQSVSHGTTCDFTTTETNLRYRRKLKCTHTCALCSLNGLINATLSV